MITELHIAAHTLIFFGYVAAMVLIPGALRNVINLSLPTAVAAGGFFVTCGFTHIGLALDKESSPFITATDHLQAGFIICFVAFFIRDLNRFTKRMSAAFVAIGIKHGKDHAEQIKATIYEAMRS